MELAFDPSSGRRCAAEWVNIDGASKNFHARSWNIDSQYPFMVGFWIQPKLGQTVFSGTLDPSMAKRELWKYF
jgi:hypothetical protein